MSRWANCFLLLVRSPDDLPRACQEVGKYLAFQQTQLQAVDTQQIRKLIGVWIDPVMVEAPPEGCGAGLVPGVRRFRIRESVGVSGIWCLCWLDPDQARALSDLVAFRETLVSALIEESPQREHPSALQFIPVFDAHEDRQSVLLHAERLRKLFPDLIGEAMTWSPATGALPTYIGAGERF